jgi:hypothetical protein
MRMMWMSGAAAMMAFSIAGVQAQSTGSQTPPTQTPQTQSQTPRQNMGGQTATLRGCVYNEKDIPGRSPNVAERAGVMEDYILVPQAGASASTGAATSGTAGTAGTATSGTAGTSGAMAYSKHKAFKLEHAADEKLSAMVGKMVEVTGKIDAESGDSARATGAATSTAGSTARSAGMGGDTLELPEFEVTTIKEITGTCPTTPDIKK